LPFFHNVFSSPGHVRYYDPLAFVVHFLQNFRVVRSCCADYGFPVRFLIVLTVFQLLPKTCNFTIFSILKLLGQMESNLEGSIYLRSSIKLLYLVPFGQQTWPLLLKIEHMGKLHVFGNNSKTVNNIRNMTGPKLYGLQTTDEK
jgi:hypothetical protein